MDIPSKHVYEVLVDAGVTQIYHANSVITACQFLRSGALLARGTVERMGCHQTPQSSDKSDKRYSIWFDVFADSVDIHDRARRDNVYGPVLFVLDAKKIRDAYTGRIWVTKLNPTKWAGLSDEERWFRSKQDLVSNFVHGQFDQMVVFRHCGSQLPFGGFLSKIIIDDPKLKTDEDVDYFSMAYGAIQLAMSDGGIRVPIRRRACPLGCECIDNYANNQERTYKLFAPHI